MGSHTWAMHFDNGTPNDPSDDLYNTVGCERCHGLLEDFDVNGAHTEIEEQLEVLADMLPRVAGTPNEVATLYSPTGGRGSATRALTEAEKRAAWNHNFVEYDLSHGVHNFVYARKLLADATRAMTAQIKPPPGLVGDFNGDKRVDFEDLFLFVAQFGKSSSSPGFDPRFDLSGNGVVGFVDWTIFLDNFGKTAVATKPALALEDNGRNVGASLSLLGSNRPSIDRDHLGVSLRAENLTEMRGYGVVVTYDPKVLSFVRVLRANDGLIPNEANSATIAAVEQAPGRVLVSDALAGDKAVVGSGLLADLIFKRSGPADASSVTIDFAQLSDLKFGVNRPGEAAQGVLADAAIYSLNQNYPNPFNPTTTINYGLADPGEVKIVVYNTLGQVVRTLVDHYRLAGNYSVLWDGRDSAGRQVSSGVYLYRIEASKFSAVRRMVLLK